MFTDKSRAYMFARASSDIFVELCEEDKTEPAEAQVLEVNEWEGSRP